MTDLLVPAAIGAGLTVFVGVSILVLSLKLSTAKDERETARVHEAELEERTKWQDGTIERLTKDLKTEQERADALDDAYQKLAADQSVDGSYQRLLQGWATNHAAARGRTVALPAPAATPAPGPDDLLPPGA